MDSISVQNACPSCAAGHPTGRRKGRIIHSVYSEVDGKAIIGKFADCANYDSECRHAAEPFGFHSIAWLPTKCRNEKWRWFCWVERHPDGTATLARGS